MDVKSFYFELAFDVNRNWHFREFGCKMRMYVRATYIENSFIERIFVIKF